jgi:hypothetical protein
VDGHSRPVRSDHGSVQHRLRQAEEPDVIDREHIQKRACFVGEYRRD